jgi:hypothetical protein
MQVLQHACLVEWRDLPDGHHHLDTHLLHVECLCTLQLLMLAQRKGIGIVLHTHERDQGSNGMSADGASWHAGQQAVRGVVPRMPTAAVG